MDKQVAHIFYDCSGYHYCSDLLPYLDARGVPFPTKRAALEAAYAAGYSYAVGSGCYRKGVRSIIGQCPSAAEYQQDHKWAIEDQARYA